MDIGDFLTDTRPDKWADNYIADQLGPLRSFFDFLYLGGVVDMLAVQRNGLLGATFLR
jgi:hypothetical protein